MGGEVVVARTRPGRAGKGDDVTTMPMELMDKIRDVEEGLSSRRVFGEPYEKDGVTMIPAAKVNGGVGGGGGEGPQGEGSGTGSGFGLSAKPVGMYVISD